MKKIVFIFLTVILFISIPVNCLSAGVEENQISIEPKVVWEGYNTSIEVAGIEESTNSYDISFIINNNSNLNLSFDVHAYAVNGVMGDESQYSFYTGVPSGKKAISKVTVSKYWMWDTGSETIEYIDFLFWAYDNAKSYKEFETDIVRVETSAYTGDYIYSFKKEPSYSDDRLAILGNLTEDLQIPFEVINNSNEYISIEADDASVNGWAFDTFIQVYDDYVFPDCILLCNITIDSEFADTCDIQELTDFEFSLVVQPLDNYENEYTIGPIIIK